MTTAINYQPIRRSELDPLLEVLRPPLIKVSNEEQPLRVAADRFHLVGGHEWVLPSAEALSGYQYVEMNAPQRKHVLTIDVDHPFDQGKLEDFGLTPNYLGINRQKRTWQAIFMLKKRVFGNWDNRAMQWMRAVEQGFNSIFDGDDHFVHRFSRNPFSVEGDYDWHFQNDRLFTLEELNDAAYAALPFEDWVPRRKSAKLEKTYDSDGLMREAYLFNSARFAGYRMVADGKHPSRQDILRVLIPINEEIAATEVRGGYPISDLERIARSVARFCSSMRAGGGNGQPLFTREQCIAGGNSRGPVLGAWMRDTGRLEALRAQNSANASEKHARVIMHFLDGLSVEEITRREGYTDRTVKDAIKARFELPSGSRVSLTATYKSLGIVTGKAIANQLHVSNS